MMISLLPEGFYQHAFCDIGVLCDSGYTAERTDGKSGFKILTISNLDAMSRP